jgi:predicted transcriptional regulator
MERIKRLPDSELEVMLLIWQSTEPIHTGEILQRLKDSRECNLQMVQSALNRLTSKGFVQCDKIGRLNYYTPLVDKELYLEQETDSFVERLYNNSPSKLVTKLLSKQSMSETEISEIRRLLEKGGE